MEKQISTTKEDHPLAILLGGLANTTSVARSLGRKGIPVAVIAHPHCFALTSKYVQPYPIPYNVPSLEYYQELLINKPIFPSGSVIFPCEDASIEFVAANKSQLKNNYILDIQNPVHQLQLLDKQKTLSLAEHAGINAPRSWSISNYEDIETIKHNIKFPVLIKPIFSHIFQQRFGKKLIYVENVDQLISYGKEVIDADIKFMLCEFIPGSDDLLSSYYVYIDKDNKRLFEFTKRVIRRSPPNFGGGSYHITEWLPKTAEKGFQFFSGIGFQGLGNIEFKKDPRDGELKIIECNARYTAAQELITRSGLDMPYIIYRYLTKNELPDKTDFREFMTLWLPFEDFDAWRDLRSVNQLTFTQWLRSVLRKQVFCYYDLDDPKPFISATKSEFMLRIKRIIASSK